MKMITNEGKVIEGTPLTDAECEVLENFANRLSNASVYLGYGQLDKLIAFLAKTYVMTLRSASLVTVDTSPQVFEAPQQIEEAA